METITSANRPSEVQRECFNFYAEKVLYAIQTIQNARIRSSSDRDIDEIEDSWLACRIFEVGVSCNIIIISVQLKNNVALQISVHNDVA